ncbi:M56 family metallopeptidase [Pontimicrobium sp. MEBiC01747]
MLHYIIQTVVFQLFFLILYDLFLKRETFFNWNRAYLLASVMLSIILPFIKVDAFKTVIPVDYTIMLPEIVMGYEETVTHNTNRPLIELLNTNTNTLPWGFILSLGCTIAALLFVYKLIGILILVYKNPKTKYKDSFLIELLNSKSAFSFFNYIFIGEQIKGTEKIAIIAHEEVHVKQKHSIDLLLFEVLRILFWFNPLVYIYQRKIANLHEFLADSEAVKINKTAYYENLLAQVFQTQNISFINPFFKKSLIKKRIVMLNKTKSKQFSLIKYALLIPMVVGMLFYTSCSKDVIDDNTVVSNKNIAEYTFSVEKEEDLSTEKQAIKDKGELFLKANSEAYVRLITYNENTKKSTYNIVAATNDLTKKHEIHFIVDFKDGSTFSTYADEHAVLLESENIKSMNVIKTEKQKWSRIVNNVVTFNELDRVPAFPGCETLRSNAELKDCFNKELKQLVIENFNQKKLESIGEKGQHRISLFFTIGKDGNVETVKVRAKYKAFEAEGERLVSLIPTLIPGEFNGKTASTNYYLPIKFEIK